MANQIDLYTDQLTTSLPHIKAGKLKALLALSPDRISQLTDAEPSGHRHPIVRRGIDGWRVRAYRNTGGDARHL
jgi:hypothetical protein